MNIKANEIIDALGGTTLLAKKCNTTLAAVSTWRKNGIPDYRYQFLSYVYKKQLREITDPHLGISKK